MAVPVRNRIRVKKQMPVPECSFGWELRKTNCLGKAEQQRFLRNVQVT